MIYSPIAFDTQSLERYQILFKNCFPNASQFSVPMLDWLYAKNPDGAVIGFDAWEGDELVAHYACIPTQVKIDGVIQKALLSLNTATHPAYQGKGLFTTLAQMTYDTAVSKGFCGVYGVANANSTPGFIKKLGFQLVEPLQAMIGVGRLNINFDAIARETQFERVWTSESLKWRCANPSNRIYHHASKNHNAFYARTHQPLLSAYAELSPNQVCVMQSDQRALFGARLYLGLVPHQACRFSSYINIPTRLKPSPLNLIYRHLSSSPHHLVAGSIHFSFLDFDAY